MKINSTIKSCHGRETAFDLSIPDSKGSFPIILFCHGFKGYKDWGHFNLIADEFVKNNFIVLKFNFTFNGGTAKEVIDFPDLEAFGMNSYLKEVEDIHHMIKRIKSKEIPVDKWNGELSLLGHSRGGGMVTLAGAEDGFVSNVISWAGISDCIARLPEEEQLLDWERNGVRYVKNGRTKQDMPMKFQFVKSLLHNKERLSIKDAVKKIGAKHLIIHGTGDEAVPFQNAKDLNHWNPLSKLVVIEGANHVFGGKHPWEQNILPEHTVIAIVKTIQFLNK